MSMMTDLFQKLGLIEMIGARITWLESKLMLVHRMPSLGSGRHWHSESNAREFQRTHLAHQAINEFYAKLPVVR